MLKTSGFALRKNDYREYDRIYTVYTFDFGKISLLARGARKIKSKLAPHLEGLNEVRLNFAKGKIFNHLSGANVISINKGLLRDGEKISFFLECFNLLDRFIKPEEGDRKIYELIKEIFAATSSFNFSSYDKIRIYFFWRLIDLLGYRPQLDECVLCGNIIIGSSKFNITENIVICDKCRGEGVKISEATLGNLRKIFCVSLQEFMDYNLDSQLLIITNNAKQIKLSEL